MLKTCFSLSNIGSVVKNKEFWLWCSLSKENSKVKLMNIDCENLLLYVHANFRSIRLPEGSITILNNRKVIRKKDTNGRSSRASVEYTGIAVNWGMLYVHQLGSLLCLTTKGPFIAKYALCGDSFEMLWIKEWQKQKKNGREIKNKQQGHFC